MSARIVVEERIDEYVIGVLGSGVTVRSSLPAEVRVEFGPGEQDTALSVLESAYSRARASIEATR